MSDENERLFKKGQRLVQLEAENAELKKRVEELESIMRQQELVLTSPDVYVSHRLSLLQSLCKEMGEALESVLLGWASSDDYHKHYKQTKSVLAKFKERMK